MFDIVAPMKYAYVASKIIGIVVRLVYRVLRCVVIGCHALLSTASGLFTKPIPFGRSSSRSSSSAIGKLRASKCPSLLKVPLYFYYSATDACMIRASCAFACMELYMIFVYEDRPPDVPIYVFLWEPTTRLVVSF